MEQLHLKLLGLMKGLAIPFEPSWCSRLALFGLRLGEQQIQGLAFS